MRVRRWICVLLMGLLGCDSHGIHSGDRVLVAKCLYETGIKPPERYDVVVFKFPEQPVKEHVPTNYIKRLLGLPGEVIAIFFGQIYRYVPAAGEEIPGAPKVDDPKELWKLTAQGRADNRDPAPAEFQKKIQQLFEDGKFQIVRKPPAAMMAMRRIVNDNNYQPADLKAFPGTQRWEPRDGSRWKAAADHKSFSFTPNDGQVVDWLTYQHLVRRPVLVGGQAVDRKLIVDQMGYKTGLGDNWVGNLMLEANVDVTQATGDFFMELNKGPNRFQAKWDLASGQCTLLRLGQDGKTEELGSAATPLRGVGKHLVRFANFDSRLTVWVDRDLPFGDGVAYDPPEFVRKDLDQKPSFDDFRKNWGPGPNDLERPASFGAKGAGVTIGDVSLWRDTYYVMSAHRGDVALNEGMLTKTTDWDAFKQVAPTGYYVYPNHYLCLGDNSSHSSDSRAWGLVPDRLMLGRALMVYYPIQRAGLIR